MKKYELFGQFLTQSQREAIPLTFAQVERVLGQKLPKSAYTHRPWWSNNASNNALTQVWLNAGYRTEQVDMHARRLVFRRAAPAKHAGAPAEREHGVGSLFGKLKGWVRFEPGFDATLPADPELASYLDDKYGPRARGQGRA